MRLSTMWNVDRTVDSLGSSPIAEQILAAWSHDRGSARFFRSSANFLYTFRHAGERFFLRFADGSERARDVVEAEVALLLWLAGVGIEVVRPVSTIRGSFVETTETDRGTFHAVVFAAVEGAQFDLDEFDPPRFQAWGAALGRLHVAIRACPPAIASARPTCRDHLEHARLCVPDSAPAVREELDRVAATLDALPVGPDAYGLVHFDFEPDNLVWVDRAVHVLDFDGCARCWYEADIAFAFRDLFDGGVGLDDPAGRAFLRGYTAHRSLDEGALRRVPVFSRLANLLVYGSIARALDLSEIPDFPEWLNDLIARLRGRMEAYELSLATGHSLTEHAGTDEDG